VSGFQLPPLSVEALPSGLTLVAIQRPGLPLFHARLSLPAGARNDPRGKAGLANFVVDLLRRGTQQRSADQIDDLIEGMGANLSLDASADEAALSLTVLSELRAQALDALLEVALTPSFPHEEVASARRRTLATLQGDLDEPAMVASRAMLSLGFGGAHPYGHPVHGTKRDVETFSRADVEHFHARHFSQQGALLAVVAPDEPQALAAFAKDHLARCHGAWPTPAPLDASAEPLPPAPAMPAWSAKPAGAGLRALAIHKEESSQAQVRIVTPGLQRNNPIYAPSIVANNALGGAFTSVLVDAIRVDRGLSYSVSSRLLLYRHAGLSVFSSFTRNETLRALVDVALEKMRGYAQAGPTQDQLENSRTYLAGLFPLGLESHEALAEQVADAILDGLGLDHLRTYRGRIQAVTLEAARDAAAQLSPARPGAQIVVVGDGEVAKAALGDLCPVEVKPLEEFA
jgi:zinc protease